MVVDDIGCEVVPTIEALIEEAKNGYEEVSYVLLHYDLTSYYLKSYSVSLAAATKAWGDTCMI